MADRVHERRRAARRRGRQWGAVPVIVTVLLLTAGCGGDAPVAQRGAMTDPPVEASDPVSPDQPATTPVAEPTPAPRAVIVPAVAGLPRAEAAQALRAVGLRLGEVRRIPSDQARGTVLRQSIASGGSVAQGSMVALATAIPHPRVPGVLGASSRAATAALRQAGYRVDLVMQTVTSGRDGAVLRQTPRPQTRTKVGTSVTVVVARVVRPVASPPAENCTPGYRPCLSPSSDYDCAGGSGDGPQYATGPVYVTGSDPYDLDQDGDGVACES